MASTKRENGNTIVTLANGTEGLVDLDQQTADQQQSSRASPLHQVLFNDNTEVAAVTGASTPPPTDSHGTTLLLALQQNQSNNELSRSNDDEKEEVSSEPEISSLRRRQRRRRRSLEQQQNQQDSSSTNNNIERLDDVDQIPAPEQQDLLSMPSSPVSANTTAADEEAVMRRRTQSEPDVRLCPNNLTTLRQRRGRRRILAAFDHVAASNTTRESLSAPPTALTFQTPSPSSTTEQPVVESLISSSSPTLNDYSGELSSTMIQHDVNSSTSPSSRWATDADQRSPNQHSEGSEGFILRRRLGSSDDEQARERLARSRWIRINRRFQLVISLVALVFSLLLFMILICWVVLTSAYVVSFDKSCDVPLKAYFSLASLQLVLDIFRNDIMRFVFRWDSRSNHRIPAHVVAYNVAYLIYALMVLRLGIRSVFVYDETPSCRYTAPDFFNASIAFVTLSIAAWTTIIGGYVVPFCVVAVLLTLNGYNPSADIQGSSPGSAPQAVFPAAYATSGAPPGCVEQLPEVSLQGLPADYPPECCICLEVFHQQDVIVETKCHHIFHKTCLRECLRQARTCPVCRDDIPSSLEAADATVLVATGSNLSSSSGRNDLPATIPVGPTGRPLAGLLRALHHSRNFVEFAAAGQSRSASIEMEEGRTSAR